MRRLTLILAMALTACSSSGGGDDDDSSGKPTSCDPVADRMGTYLIHFVETGGNCGPVPDQIVRLGDVPPGQECAADAAPIISANGCKIESATTCFDDGTGLSVRSVGVTTQDDESGAHISGIATVTVSNAAGVEQCLSTYRVSYERQ